MTMLLTMLPYAFSLSLGLLATQLILPPKENCPLIIKLCLGQAVGLAISAYLTFLSFILFDQLIPFFVIFLNLILFLTLTFFVATSKENHFPKPKITWAKTKQHIGACLAIFLLAFFLIRQSNFYVHGGWDAWSVWNLKAKFLYLGGESWGNMFEPMLWRSSPHYPLLLPLINVWAWIFTQAPVYYVPQSTAILFSLLTATFLYAAIKQETKSRFAFLPILLFLGSPFVVRQCISQYSDILFAFYLLSGIYCLMKTKEKNSGAFAAMAGLLLGCLTFTKGEGLLAAGILSLLFIPYLGYKSRSPKDAELSLIFFTALFLTSLPLLFFKLVYAPDNVTFTNGLVSQTHPSTLPRLKAILIYYFLELRHMKWNGLLIITALTLLIKFRQMLNSRNILISLFLAGYFGMITVYYYINTQFEIIWWLKFTLARVIFATLPVILLLTFLSLFEKKT